MENDELKILIEAFKAYRDLLDPIQSSLSDFASTYDSMKGNIEKLNVAFGGDIKENLEKIYKTLSGQAEKASDLSSRIDNFLRLTNKYASQTEQLLNVFSKLEDRIKAVNDIENRAEEQLSRLDELIKEKAKNYDVRELSKTLDSYNANVLKVSEFINKDVAESLSKSGSKLESMKGGLDEVIKKSKSDNVSLENLLMNFNSSAELLRRVTEKGDVNEMYIFEIIDKWALDRKVKTKGK